MLLVFQIAIVLLLLLIFAQDVKDRMVWVWAFPLLAGTLVGFSYQQQHTYDYHQCLFNLQFLFVQLGLVSLYFSAKQKKWINITRHLLGWGDILFLAAIAFYLPVINFIGFYLLSLIIILFCWFIKGLLFKQNSKHIPLAGLQALFFAVLITAGWITTKVDLMDSTWILKFIA